MRYVERPPMPALAPFVASIWHFEGDLLAGRERILPRGSMQLLVNLAEDELRTYRGDGYRILLRHGGAALCGAHSGHFAIDTAEQRAIVGVSFRPGGAYPFFATPAGETAELHVTLDALWGRDGAVLRERLLEAPTREARLGVLEAALLERAVRPLERDRAIDVAVDALSSGATVGAVVDHLGTTPKRFIRRFTDVVGLTPKRFARVRRFRRVVDAIDTGRCIDWARLAAGLGYFDQAHLIREFRAFAAMTPTAYRRRPDATAHVALD